MKKEESINELIRAYASCCNVSSVLREFVDFPLMALEVLHEEVVTGTKLPLDQNQGLVIWRLTG